ncbi:OB-fold-containig protein [Pleionea sediminis]|uniref:OB-fold-containig protein n=1 Tax=Pleionea sediminis TaxID=2569479 RepID=UPI0011852A05|nr:OB-fold-containig protein [Pleionea sediminis]
MNEIWSIASSFPTSIFTTINLILIGYWLIVAFGLLDFDFFDLDIDTDADVSDLSGFATFLATLGLTGVPITIVLTILMFCAWLISYIASKYLFFWVESESLMWLIGSLTSIGSLALALPITAWCIRPLRKLFKKLHGGSDNKNLLGRPCRVRSSKVNKTFGEAVCDFDGASLLLKVRADEKYQFKRGDTAYIVDYDATKSVYFLVDKNDFHNS